MDGSVWFLPPNAGRSPEVLSAKEDYLLERIIRPRIHTLTSEGISSLETSIRSGVFTVRKWHEGQDPETDIPYHEVGFKNAYVNTGGALLLDLILGAGGTAFNAANAYIGVGDSTAAVVASQTDLQASTYKLRVGMMSGFPSRSGQVATWKASFGSSQANFAWNEFALFNASAGGTMLNRVVSTQGTKSGGTWEIAFTITTP